VTAFRLPPLYRHNADQSQPSQALFSLREFHCFRAVLERLNAHAGCAAICICCIRNKFSGFYNVGGSIVFSLLVFKKLLEPDKRLKLKMDSFVRYSDVRDGFTGRYCNVQAVCAVFCGRMC
jgi:hypothetical protein